MAGASPTIPVRCCSRRRSTSRRTTRTTSAASAGFSRYAVRPRSAARSLGSGSVSSARPSVEMARSRAAASSRALDGSCSAPVTTRQSGSRVPSASKASSNDGDHRCREPGRFELRVDPHGVLEIVGGDEDAVGHQRSAINRGPLTRRVRAPRRGTGGRPAPPSRPSLPRASPGRFTISVLPRVPATPRDSHARGKSGADRARSASAIPGACRSSTAVVASGVTSRAARPVPPVVRITSTSPESAQRDSFPAMRPVSSGTMLRTVTS